MRAVNLCYTCRSRSDLAHPTGKAVSKTAPRSCVFAYRTGVIVNATQSEAFLNPDPIWRISLDAPPAGPPVPTGNLLLVATQESGPSAHPATLYALGPRDGSTRWQQTFEYALISGLASSPPLILVSTTSTDLIRGEGTLVALNASGEKLCRWTPGVQRLSTPAVAGDTDTVYVTADTRSLLAINLVTGEEQDQVPLEASASLSAPALADEVIYVPCRGPHLLAVELDGQPRWRFDATGSPDAWLDDTPVIVEERLFATLTGGTVVALRATDGSLAWRVKVGPTGKSLSAPATDGERLFVGARDGLYALDLTDGQRAWVFATQRRIEAAPVVAGGVVYATCHDHHLYAIEAATGQELWQHEVERRIKTPPVLADCGEPARPCVLVIDRGGTLTAIARPLSAEEHEAAGHWVAAAELWGILGRPLKQAEALERHAQSLAEQPCSDEERATAWTDAAHAFEAEGEVERADVCRQEVARWLGQPLITLDVQHEGLVLDAWSRIQFVVRNEGYGPARNLVIRASGDQFEGQVTATRRIATLQAGRERTDWLDTRPRAFGGSVPLRVSAEYEDQAGETCICEQTIYISVAKTEMACRTGQTSRITLFGTRFVLPFERLSPVDFERLCLWLVEREGYLRGEHLGLAGSEQGRDVIARKPTPQGEELWYFQCKRYRSIGAKTLKDEVDKYLQLAQGKPHLLPTGVVFVVSCAVSAKVREAVGDYCAQHDLAYEFWALTELDMRVKRHPDLLKEFFSIKAWRGQPAD